MKKLLLLIAVIYLSLGLTACKKGTLDQDDQKIIVATAFYPMDDILNLIEPDLEALNYSLEIISFNDPYYVQPNEAVKDRKVSANMIQHQFFMSGYNKNYDAELIQYLPIYYAKFGLYSKDFSSIDQITSKKSIIIPNDPYNIRRALLLLDQLELITLKNQDQVAISESEIDTLIDNPMEFKFVCVALSSLASTYKNNPDHLVTMYPTYAKSIGLEGTQERIADESLTEQTKPYAIGLSGLKSRLNEPKIQALITVLNSQKVHDWLIENYGYASIPALPYTK